MSCSDFQPPSPTLSPGSQVRHYRDQLEKAHSIIDQLENLLSEKQSKKENHNSMNIPKLKMHQKNQSLFIDPSLPSIPFKSYVTPRESQSRVSTSLYNSHLSPINFPSYIQEIQQKHLEIVNQSIEEQNIKNNQIREIQEKVAELREELLHQQERTRLSELERSETSKNLEHLNNEVVIVQEKLKQSKLQGQQWEQVLHQLDQEKENHENKYFVSTNKSLKRKRSEIKHKKPDKLKEQLQMLRNEVSQLRQQKLDHEELYKQKINELEKRLKPTSVDVEQLEANLSPNRRDVRIFKDGDLLMQLRVSGQGHERIDTLEDVRIKTESSKRVIRKQYIDEQISVQSFQTEKHKNRSCDACTIF